MKLKRSVSLFFAILMVVLCLPISVLAAGSANPMKNTYVMDDLRAMGYVLEDYVKDTSADFVTVIDFTEYGYDYHGDQRYYGLYFYIYNPSGREIMSYGNKIEMSYTDKANQKRSVVKYSLETLSVSTDANYENVLYKFCVVATEDIAANIHRSMRKYEVSAIELLFDSSTGAKPEAFELGGKYVFTGYQQYFGIRENDASTLYRTYEKFDVCFVDIRPASWFSHTSDLGQDYRYEVSSVYFAIPDYFIKKYGNVDDDPKDGGTSGLYSVKGEYYKYVTDGLLLTNQEWYDTYHLYDYAGSYLTKQPTYSNGTVGEGSLGFFKPGNIFTQGPKTTAIYQFSYNMRLYSTVDGGMSVYSNDPFSHICNVLLSESSDVAYVSRDTFLSVYNQQGRNHYGDTGGLYIGNANVFSDLGWQPYEIKVDQGSWNDSIKSYASTHSSWLQKIFNGDFYADKDGYAKIDPIIEITNKSFIAGDGGDNDISEKLFIMSDDVEPLKNYYEEYDSGNHVYLMRFDTNPYYCPEVVLTKDVSDPYESSSDETAYYFEKVIYEDFDILEFKFKDKDGNYHTVPVNSKPIDIVGAVVPGNNHIQPNPNDPTGAGANGLFDTHPLLKIIIALLILIVVIIAIYFLSKPFIAIFKGIGSATDRRYKYYDVKQQMREDRESKRQNKRAKKAKKGKRKYSSPTLVLKKKYDSPSAEFEGLKHYNTPSIEINGRVKREKKKYSSPSTEKLEFKKKPGRKSKNQ